MYTLMTPNKGHIYNHCLLLSKEKNYLTEDLRNASSNILFNAAAAADA
jgi:hypothetical protein